MANPRENISAITLRNGKVLGEKEVNDDQNHRPQAREASRTRGDPLCSSGEEDSVDRTCGSNTRTRGSVSGEFSPSSPLGHPQVEISGRGFNSNPSFPEYTEETDDEEVEEETEEEAIIVTSPREQPTNQGCNVVRRVHNEVLLISEDTPISTCGENHIHRGRDPSLGDLMITASRSRPRSDSRDHGRPPDPYKYGGARKKRRKKVWRPRVLNGLRFKPFLEWFQCKVVHSAGLRGSKEYG